jgi:hypothetical protein
MNTPRAFVTASAFVAVSLSSSGAFAQAVLTPLPVPSASALSKDGTTVVGTTTFNEQTRAFRWRAESGVEYPALPKNSIGSRGNTVSADGRIFGGATLYQGMEEWDPHKWYAISIDGGPWIELPKHWHEVVGLSDDGDVVATISSEDYIGPFISGGAYRRSTNTDFWCNGESSDFDSSVTAIDAKGHRTIGSAFRPMTVNWAAAYWDLGNSKPVYFLTNNSKKSGSGDISDDGQTIIAWHGNSTTNPTFIARWTRGAGETTIYTIPKDRRVGRMRLSGDASVALVGVMLSSGIPNGGVYWTISGGVVDVVLMLAARGVDLSGWSRLNPIDLSRDGRIILCQGVNPDGHQQAFW